MEENKMIIKNMEYWKKKNNIPGIDTIHEAGLTGDGRASSSPFQQTEGTGGMMGAMDEGMEKEEKETKLIAGQFLTPGEEPNTYIDEEQGDSYTDPDGFIEMDEEGFVVDNDYKYIVDENNVVIGIQDPNEEMGGVGETPMEMGGVGSSMYAKNTYKS
jgi:hypothetical protein